MKLLLVSLLLVYWPQQNQQISARFERAAEFQRLGDLENAAKEYRDLLKLAPSYAEAQANYGVVLARLDRYDEAVAAYNEAFRLNPKLTPILLNLGIAHYRTGNFSKAADALEQFLISAPDHAQAHQLLGVSLVESGRYGESAPHLEFGLRSEPDNPLQLYYAGIAYLRLRKPETDSILARLESSDLGKPLALVLRAQQMIEEFDLANAAQTLETAARLNADLPRLQGLLGLVYAKLGRGPEAIPRFEKELERSPNDVLSLYYLAESLEKQGDLSQARRRIETALEQDPHSPEALTLLSQILLKLNQPTEALEAIDKALASAKAAELDSLERRYLRARIYQRLGRKADAAREMAAVQKSKTESQQKPE